LSSAPTPNLAKNATNATTHAARAAKATRSTAAAVATAPSEMPIFGAVNFGEAFGVPSFRAAGFGARPAKLFAADQGGEPKITELD
jgi:hypothetical protein